jgi:tetratricopeptide (TPR) repeat protein
MSKAKRGRSAGGSAHRLSPKAARVAERAMAAHQRGDLDQAATGYMNALRQAPRHPDVNFNLALIYAQTERAAAAIPLLETALLSRPDDPAILTAFANVSRQCGQTDEAIDGYIRVLAIDANNLNARYNLATLAHNTGQLDLARKHYEVLLDAASDDGQIWGALGDVWFRQDRISEAVACLHKAHELLPKHPEIAYRYGTACLQAGDLTGAEAPLRLAVRGASSQSAPLQALVSLLRRSQRHGEAQTLLSRELERTPGRRDAQQLLVELLIETGDSARALVMLEEAVAADPDWLAGRIQLATAALGEGLDARVKAVLAQTLQRFPDSVDALSDVGLVYRLLGDSATAHELFTRACELAPNDVQVLNQLGLSVTDLGDLPRAEALLDQALAVAPEDPNALYNRSRTRRYRDADEPFVCHLSGVLERLRATGNAAVSLNPMVEFALGKVANDLGHFDEAFAHYVNANQRHRDSVTYDRERHASWLQSVATTFSKAHFDASVTGGNPSELPVLIVGMPRSGTTLVEQILASHPQVHGAGELRDLAVVPKRMNRRTGKPYPAGFSALSATDRAELANGYVSRIAELGGDAMRVTDKLPTNFLHLGLAATLLPNVRVIHCRRDPMDTCLANYMQYFTEGHPYAYDLGDIAHFYAQYRALMAHWEDALPLTIAHVDYESVVEDVEREARRLVAYLGLEWDDRCLRFYESDRRVDTASNWQVRQPIYTDASRRWRRYELHLGPLRDALAQWLPDLEIELTS